MLRCQPVVDGQHLATGPRRQLAADTLMRVEIALHPAAAMQVEQERQRTPAATLGCKQPQRHRPGRPGTAQVGGHDRGRRRLVEQLDHAPELLARLRGRGDVVRRALLPDQLAHELRLGVHDPVAARQAAPPEQKLGFLFAEIGILEREPRCPGIVRHRQALPAASIRNLLRATGQATRPTSSNLLRTHRPADPDAASVRDVRFEDCLIWGRSSMSLLVRNQDFRFERCRIVGYMVANGSGLPPLSILFSRCEITDEPTPAFAPGYLIDVAEGGSGVGVDRCTITTARQHIGNLSDAKVTRTRFVAEVRTEALDENWLVLLYRGHVQDCTFHDALPSSGGGPITVNYGLNTSWEGMKLGEEGQPAHTLLLGQLGWCQLDRAILRVQLGASALRRCGTAGAVRP